MCRSLPRAYTWCDLTNIDLVSFSTDSPSGRLQVAKHILGDLDVILSRREIREVQIRKGMQKRTQEITRRHCTYRIVASPDIRCCLP
jgi:hypothetical protein